jgi:flavin reductase (DIM6/NTAB) family NADH-FMN oxidoreductase RutF
MNNQTLSKSLPRTDIDLSRIAARDRYKLLISTVVPRPIALVTSVNAEGRINAAPFSFFTAVGSDPPMVVLGIGDRSPGVPKDTAQNIRATREFAVNLVDEAIAAQMNVCAIDFPAEINELEEAGLTCARATEIRPPLIAESPVSFECREHATIEVGRNRIVLGEVLRMHIRDDLLDAEQVHVKTEDMHLVGRMQGGGWYTKTGDAFLIPRITLEQWKSRSGDASRNQKTSPAKGNGALP